MSTDIQLHEEFLSSEITWATAEVGVIKEKVEETAPEPAEVRAKLVSFLWSSQVDAELASRSASPPCCLAVHVPPDCLTMKVKTAMADATASQLSNRATRLRNDDTHCFERKHSRQSRGILREV